MSSVSEHSFANSYRRSVARRRRTTADHLGMSTRTHFQPGATIIQVCGAIEAANANRLSNYIESLAGAERTLILDLRGVDFFGSEGFRALLRIAEKSRRTGSRWAVVGSAAVDRFLQLPESKYRLPVAASVEEALQQPSSPASDSITPAWVTRC